MSDRQTIRLIGPSQRDYACERVRVAPVGHVVVIRPPNRSLDQNSKFHAACADIAKAKPMWNGLHMDDEDWKALLVVSHAIATKGDEGPPRMVPDLEGHGMVQLRESTAKMSVSRSSSLIEYTLAWAATHGIALKETA